MATIAEKLKAVLNSKNAIKSKFNLADDLPFSQYADNISSDANVTLGVADANGNFQPLAFTGTEASNSGDPESAETFYSWNSTLPAPGGTGGSTIVSGGEFYLCNYVNRNYFSYNTLVVSGMPTDAFVGATYMDHHTGEGGTIPADIAARDPNGTYTLQNPADSTSNWYWQSENGCRIKTRLYSMGFVIYPGDYDELFGKFLSWADAAESCTYPVPDDYTSYTWTYTNGSSTTTVEDGSVAVPEPEAVEQYWEGYELLLNNEGKYDYATEATRLTYADYMPVAGRIYDADCTMEITNANLSDDALYSCPRNMTGYENEEWVITANGYYDDRYPWKAFDGNLSTRWNDSTRAYWLQWQNKNRKVLIKQLIIYTGNTSIINQSNSYIQGSNDGENWVDIVRGELANKSTQEHVDGLTKCTLDLSKYNLGFYSYYRIACDFDSVNGDFNQIEAYSQIHREVPK